MLRRLLRAKDRMDAASREQWPVSRLASVSGVSEAHFARSFREAFGVPPHRYLLTRRIERAKALLRDTDLASPRSPSRPAGTAWAPSAAPSATSPAKARARSGAREKAAPHELDRVPHCYRQRRAPARPHDRSFGEAAAGSGRYWTAASNKGGPMSQGVGVVGLYVRDQDEALEFYVEKLGFRSPHRCAQRRLSLADGAAPGAAVVPARPVQAAAADGRRGDCQTLHELVAKGAMPPLVLVVDDCRAAYERMRAQRRGVHAGAGRALRQRRRQLPRSVRQRLEDDRGALGPPMRRVVQVRSCGPWKRG